MTKSTKKRPNNRKKWLIYLVLGGVVVDLIRKLYKKGQDKERIKKFKEFFKKEEKEIKDFAAGKLTLKDLYRDTGSLLKEYFIPHGGNHHKPKILHTKSLASIFLVLFTLKVVVTGYLFFIYPNKAMMSEIIINRVLELTNLDRADNKLHELTINPSLSASALLKAQDMVEKNYFAHHSPEGKKPWDWINRAEYPYLFVGENLAMNFSSANSAHTALMNSPTHKKNILNTRYTEVGLAVVNGTINDKNTNVLVELFATRQSTSLAIANETEPVTLPSPTTITAPVEDETEVLATETATKSQPEPEPTVVKPPVSQLSEGQDVSEEIDLEPKDSEIVQRVEEKEEKKIARKIDVTDYPDFVLNTQTQERPVKKLAVSPNVELENNPNTVISYVRAEEDKDIRIAAKMLTVTRYIFIAVIILLTTALFINIIIRISIQHKPIIIQAVVVILLLGGLLSLRMHFLEQMLGQVAVL